MKKIFFTIVFAAFGLAAAAQHDTLPYNFDLPYYFINHPNYELHNNVQHNGAVCQPRMDPLISPELINLPVAFSSYHDDFAIGFFPDSTLHVIGIAAIQVPTLGINISHYQYFYSILNGTNISFDSILFRLYTPEGDGLALREAVYLDTVSFDTTNCRIHSSKGLDPNEFPVPQSGRVYEQPIFEVFFENEIDLSDSFYLSCKFVTPGVYSDYILAWRELHTPAVDTFIFPEERYVYRIGGSSSSDPWHYGKLNCLYPMIFPIIRRDCDTCPTVYGIQHFQAGGAQAFFRWHRTELQRSWQISYGPAGTAPEDGTIVDCSQPMSGSFHFVPGTEYVVYVRGRCRFGRFEYGPWSAPYTFTLEGAGIDNTDLDDMIDITPNPASGMVEVRCSEPMALLELFNAAGDKVFSQQLSTFNFQFSIFNFPSGTYLVRITTPQGVTTRKLVKR